MPYPGGKSGSGVYQVIINQMPPHTVYVEPFLGGGGILKLKRPALSSIAIDIDSDAVLNWSTYTIPNLKIICTDAISWLANTHLSDDTLVYLDPPYLMETRSSQRQLYKYELPTDQHIRLLELIQGLTCMVMISGYYSDLYQQYLGDWRTITYSAQTRGGRTATEYLWMNFPLPLELHDYRYLGCNYRERERIKRRQARWKNRLLKMDDQERHAILAAIEELRSVATP